MKTKTMKTIQKMELKSKELKLLLKMIHLKKKPRPRKVISAKKPAQKK